MKDVPVLPPSWLSTLAEKCEAGEILYDLAICENHAADAHKPYLSLRTKQMVASRQGAGSAQFPPR